MRVHGAWRGLVAAAGVAGAAAGCDGAGAKAPAAGAPAFVECAEERGLRFHMDFLPGEQGEKFKINFYDHGTAVAVRDYDGDGDDDVYFCNQLGRNALFRNDGTGRFDEVAEAAGVALGDRICVGATFGDYDGDGDSDLYVTSTRGGNVLFRNRGDGTFEDVTAAAGLTLVAHSWQGTFLDHDLDGDLDLFVTNTAQWTYDRRDPGDRYYEGAATLIELVQSAPEANRLYRNEGDGTFVNVAPQAGVEGRGWCGDTTVFDYDDDGRPDLFVANMFGGTALYRNRGDGGFDDVTAAVLGSVPWGAVGAKAADADGDGRLDLLVLDMHSDMWTPESMSPKAVEPHAKYASPVGPSVEREELTRRQADEMIAKLRVPRKGMLFGNVLYRNAGGGKFTEVSDASGWETFWPWGAATADFDLDADVDAFIPSGMGHPFFYWPPSYLVNDGSGRFADRAADAGLEPPPGGRELAMKLGGRPAPKSSRAAAVGDFDADGRPDLVVGNFNDRAHLFQGRGPQRPFVKLRLVGTRSSREPVGATVHLRAGGRPLVRLVESASGYLAQSSATLHFGLGDADAVEACEIRWPSGARQTVDPSALQVGGVTTITEPRQP